MSDQIIIKKYSNRRLYDSANKKYITLDEIADLIKEGYEIKVIDSKSNEDITKIVLIQVIWENEKNKQDILPSPFLHMLIKYGNKVAKDFFENYFLMMFQPYLSFQDKIEQNMKTWQDTGLFPPGFNFPNPPTTPPGKSFRTVDDSHRDDKSPSYERPSTLDSLIEEKPPINDPKNGLDLLQNRIKELEQKMDRMDKREESVKKKRV